MKVSILGLGKLGRALADQVDADNIVGWDVALTDHSCQTSSLEHCLNETDAILISVPSDHFFDAVNNIHVTYSKLGCWDTAVNIPIVTFSKGLYRDKLPISVLLKRFQFNPACVVSGPMLSEEMYRSNTRAVLGYANTEEYRIQHIARLLRNTKLHVTPDVIGTSLCGILKNIYALGIGACDGLGIGDNSKACIATNALLEMGTAINSANGDPNILLTYAGIGDFLATCYSSKSRNTQCGLLWAKNEDYTEIMSEGLKNIDKVINFIPARLPIAETISKMIRTNNKDLIHNII